MMNDLFSMLAVLVIGMVVLMAGILITREPGQSLRSAFNESLAWGGALFILPFGVEILMSANI